MAVAVAGDEVENFFLLRGHMLNSGYDGRRILVSLS